MTSKYLSLKIFMIGKSWAKFNLFKYDTVEKIELYWVVIQNKIYLVKKKKIIYTVLFFE